MTVFCCVLKRGFTAIQLFVTAIQLFVTIKYSNSTITNPIMLANPHTTPITINAVSLNPQHFSLVQDAMQVTPV